MLTREQFIDYYHNDKDKLNETFRDAAPAEQDQYLKWLEEVNPPEPPDEDNVLAAAGEALSDGYAREQQDADAAVELERAVHKMMLDAPAPGISNPRVLAATKRAQRSNMLRSIRSKFRLMEEFSITECARRIGRDPVEVSAYLISEITRGSGVFTYIPEKNRFFMDNPFA